MSHTSLYLSPHLDDCVISCAGRILRDRGEGRRVVVATIFSEGGETSRAVYEHRRAEDRAALEILGPEPWHLGLPDAPFRRNFYSSFRSIIFGRHPGDGEEYRAFLGGRLGKLLDELRPGAIYVPLAVGWHIDHRLTHEAALRLPPGVNIVLYEDQPYALVAHAVRMRLQEIGAAFSGDALPPDLGPASEEEIARDLLESFDGAPYVRAFLPEGSGREECRRILLGLLAVRSRGRKQNLHPRVEEYDRGDLERIQRAVESYSSQLDDFFGGNEGFRIQSVAHARRIGAFTPYAERLWFGCS